MPHIAAPAIEYQAEVHSDDRDFARLPGLRRRTPSDRFALEILHGLLFFSDRILDREGKPVKITI